MILCVMGSSSRCALSNHEKSSVDYLMRAAVRLFYIIGFAVGALVIYFSD